MAPAYLSSDTCPISHGLKVFNLSCVREKCRILSGYSQYLNIFVHEFWLFMNLSSPLLETKMKMTVIEGKLIICLISSTLIPIMWNSITMSILEKFPLLKKCTLTLVYPIFIVLLFLLFSQLFQHYVLWVSSRDEVYLLVKKAGSL